MIVSVDVPTPIAADVLDQTVVGLPPGLQPFRTVLRLGAAFEVWTLRDFETTKNDLETSATSTGSLHHQLLAGADPVGFVRSRPLAGGPSRQVTQVAQSKLAARLAEGIREVEPQISSALPPRLTSSAAYHLFALWFMDVKQVYVVACPPTFKVIAPRVLMKSVEFMTRLRSERPIPGALRT